MNYRELQLRQLIKKDYVKKTDYQQLVQENTLLNQKITDLEKSLLNLAKQKTKTKKETETKWQQEKERLLHQHNEQLRQINLLFDDKANNYQTIDFEGLYKLLAQIAERKKEKQ